MGVGCGGTQTGAGDRGSAEGGSVSFRDVSMETSSRRSRKRPQWNLTSAATRSSCGTRPRGSSTRRAPSPWCGDLIGSETGLPEGYLRAAGELGWFAMLVPEEHGGGSVSGEGLCDLAIISEERGRALQPGPFVCMNVVAAALAGAGSPDQRARDPALRPRRSGGGHLGAGRRRRRGDLRLDGHRDSPRRRVRRVRATHVPSPPGRTADWFLVTAGGPDGLDPVHRAGEDAGSHRHPPAGARHHPALCLGRLRRRGRSPDLGGGRPRQRPGRTSSGNSGWPASCPRRRPSGRWMRSSR